MSKPNRRFPAINVAPLPEAEGTFLDLEVSEHLRDKLEAFAARHGVSTDRVIDLALQAHLKAEAAAEADSEATPTVAAPGSYLKVN